MTLARVEDALQRRAVLFDKKGDRHYDYISAWIKATRGSDPDASLYYLAVMLEGGEDPRFIVRRMVILASEDIGNADPGALSRGHRRGTGGRARRAARGALRARAGGHLPRAGAEVRRRRARARRRGDSRARARGRAGAGLAAPGRRGRDSRPEAMTTRTTGPGTSPRRSSCRRAWSASASTNPTRPRRSSRSASTRFAGRVAPRSDNRSHMGTLPERDRTRASACSRMTRRRARSLGSVTATAAADDRRGGARRWPRCSRCGRCCG